MLHASMRAWWHGRSHACNGLTYLVLCLYFTLLSSSAFAAESVERTKARVRRRQASKGMRTRKDEARKTKKKKSLLFSACTWGRREYG